jgi:hypothetical protein
MGTEARHAQGIVLARRLGIGHGAKAVVARGHRLNRALLGVEDENVIATVGLVDGRGGVGVLASAVDAHS